VQDDDENDDEFHTLDGDINDDDFFTIPNSRPAKLSPCVLVDNYRPSGKIARCCSTENLVPLAWLFGAWEVDISVEDNSNFDLYGYGICSRHFNFDNSK